MSERAKNIVTYSLVPGLVAFLVWLYGYSPWALRYAHNHFARDHAATWQCVGACPGGANNATSGGELLVTGGLLNALIFVGLISAVFSRKRTYVIGLGVALLLSAAAYFFAFTTNGL
jgi:hypothetical protein